MTEVAYRNARSEVVASESSESGDPCEETINDRAVCRHWGPLLLKRASDRLARAPASANIPLTAVFHPFLD